MTRHGKPSTTCEKSTPESIEINVRMLSGQELSRYRPEQRFWALRALWEGDLREGSANMSAVEAASTRLVVIRIEFINRSSGQVPLGFENYGCKAELLSLTLTDPFGKRIAPERNLHIRPKADLPRKASLSPAERYVYDLVGELAGDTLVFPGARYRLPESGTVGVQFTFNGVHSNVALFELPLAP